MSKFIWVEHRYGGVDYLLNIDQVVSIEQGGVFDKNSYTIYTSNHNQSIEIHQEEFDRIKKYFGVEE